MDDGQVPQRLRAAAGIRAAVNADSGLFVPGPQLQVRDYLVAGPYKNLKKYKPQDWNEIVVVVKGKTPIAPATAKCWKTA